MGDFNAIVGEGQEVYVVSKYGLGNRNERGEWLVNFCRQNSLIVRNTWFNQHKRRYTWNSPVVGEKYQIDYILIDDRFRNSLKNANVLPGADNFSDHNLVELK